MPPACPLPQCTSKRAAHPPTSHACRRPFPAISHPPSRRGRSSFPWIEPCRPPARCYQSARNTTKTSLSAANNLQKALVKGSTSKARTSLPARLPSNDDGGEQNRRLARALARHHGGIYLRAVQLRLFYGGARLRQQPPSLRRQQWYGLLCSAALERLHSALDVFECQMMSGGHVCLPRPRRIAHGFTALPPRLICLDPRPCVPPLPLLHSADHASCICPRRRCPRRRGVGLALTPHPAATSPKKSTVSPYPRAK